ncbi:4-hydroxythreonine-4-phosphate dehydrogenase [uncultured Desulfobacterium sp.]|uniref:4-hydroxythreonine-4-phosphate dehydrogenase n=1 Tax=uncultured Desulfobacterium sp. TaxID=201089 RepID=A0A445MZC9_9BACT|nr:4-hydroxythreonine-4-phosphate dehydrogenase [uncultured Desulfobacterium sp.]
MHERPLVGITMGDPAGVGPEIIVKTLADGDIYADCRPVVLGDPGVLSSVLAIITADLSLNIISDPSDARSAPGLIDVMALSRLNKEHMQPGMPTVAGARAMVEYIYRAVDLIQKGRLAAMATCPINKALMHQAGFNYDGHTELIAHLTDCDQYVMMLAGQRLRVALVTIHCALREVPINLTTDMVYKTIMITAKALRDDFGIKNARLAVAALNPHAGEGGIFGDEEERIISPAVKKAVTDGYDLVGPLPADTLFFKAISGQFDAVVVMYHDQGLIPLKLMHFSDAVNVTLGLPIVRTSVDHGTAYDIAGTGKADEKSLSAAIRLAVTIASNRKATSYGK